MARNRLLAAIFVAPFAALSILLGVLSAAFAVDVVRTPDTAQLRELDSNEIKMVEAATRHINDFRARNARLPTRPEMDSWMSGKTNTLRYEGKGFAYGTVNPNAKWPKIVGEPPTDAFWFTFWDGNVWASYYSWFGGGKLYYVHDSDYFLFGSKAADVMVFGGASTALMVLALALMKGTASTNRPRRVT